MRQPVLKGQSAIEFLSTYAFVILIATFVIAMAALYISFPRSVLPSQCVFYNGVTCTDQVLTYNAQSGGARLLVFGTDSEPGIINISTFNAVLNYQNSSTSACTPDLLTAGQPFYCIANFTFTPANYVTYSGTMKLKVNYCSAPPNNISTANCITSNLLSNAVFYGGEIRVTPTQLNIPPWVLLNKTSYNYNYIPLLVTNTQNTLIPENFQLQVEFVPSNAVYQAYERADLGNIRFYQGHTELPSWCETNCTSSSTGKALFWVRLNSALNPFANTTLSMEFISNTVNYDGIYAGEAPQLSTPYAQFDNGKAVFNSYWNFEGNTIPAGFTFIQGAAITTVDNSLTFDTASQFSSYTGIIYNTGYTPPVISEAYIIAQSGGALSGGIAQQAGNAANSQGYDFNGWTGSIGYGSISTGMSSTQNINLQLVTPGVDGQAWLSSSSQVYYGNYVAHIGTATDQALPLQVYLSAGVYCCSHADSMTIQWMRVMEYPPYGAMPTVTQGAVNEFH